MPADTVDKPATDDDAAGERAGSHSSRRRSRKPAKAAEPPPRAFDVRQTAAAGLVLHLAGRHLGDAELTQAAFEAARAVANVQQPRGQMPRIGILAGAAGGHDEPTLVPARARRPRRSRCC